MRRMRKEFGGTSMKKIFCMTLVCLFLLSCLPAFSASTYRLSPSKNSLTLAPGESAVLTVKITPVNLVNHRVTWSSDNEFVASVDQKGKVTGKTAGSTYIRATIETGDSCRVSVKVSGAPITTLVLSETSLQLEVGESHTLTYTLNQTADDQRVRWSSEDPSVATVDKNGVVTAKGGGVTNIILTAVNGMTDTCSVYVPSEVTRIELYPDEVHVGIGSTTPVDAYVFPGNARDRELLWESSDERIAVVDQNGQVTGVSAGDCLIRATSKNGIRGLAHVYVSILPDALEFSGDCVVLSKKDRTRQLAPVVTPAGAEGCHIDWASSDESVVTVKDGFLTAQGYGSAVVSASALNGVGAGVTVYVCEPPTDVSFSLSTYALPLDGDGTSVSVVFLPPDTMVESYSLSIDDTSVATVSPDGVLTPVSYGTCTLTLTAEGGLTCSAEVKVFENAKALYVSQTAAELKQYEFLPITVFTETGKPYLSDLSWSSTDESVCVYTSDGCLYGKQPGSAILTFSAPGTSLTCRISVTVTRDRERKGDVVCLTFDNGPGPYTRDILEVLDRYGVKATFFLLGEKVADNTQAVQALGASDHEIGNHTWNNSAVSSDTFEETAANLAKTDSAVKKYAGRKPTVLRAPDAMLPKALFTSLIDTRCFITRGTDLGDRTGSVEDILAAAEAARYSGCILTLHDAGPHTAEALDRLLSEWLREGCRFVTVSELMELTGPKEGVYRTR